MNELEAVELESWKWGLCIPPGSQPQFLHVLLRDRRADVVVWFTRISDRLVAYALALVGKDRWYYYLSFSMRMCQTQAR